MVGLVGLCWVWWRIGLPAAAKPTVQLPDIPPANALACVELPNPEDIKGHHNGKKYFVKQEAIPSSYQRACMETT